jgi:DNA polymerase-1
MSSSPTLYILDTYSMIFQVFHAIRGGPGEIMTGPAGQPTNAVFGIFRDILNLLKTRKPDFLAAAFDGAEPVFRNELFADYKANRAEMPADLRPQIPVIKRLFDAFRVPVLQVEGFEADDLIATLAQRGSARGLDVVIVTADKDARQLIGDNVRILNLRKNVFLDRAGLEEEWGIRPDQVVDYLALTGDSVDNVPGVPSIGPKSAQELLAKFETLDVLLASLDEVKGAKRQKLIEHAETARLSRTLVALRADVPMDVDWDGLRVGDHDTNALVELCTECGFHQFRAEISPSAPAAAWATETYEIIDTPEKLREFVTALQAQTKFSFDTETTSVDPLRAELVGYSFSWEAGRAFYVPVRAPMFDKTLNASEVLEALRPILTDPTRELVGQNLKYDCLVLHRAGVEVAGKLTDTMILSYLLESGERNHNLDELASRLLGHTMIPIESLIGKGKNQIRMDDVDVPRVAAYAGEDADAAWRLEALLRPKVEQEGLWPLYADLERPLIGVLARMEAFGIKVDVPRLKALSTEFAVRLDQIETEIYATSGRVFNISSAQQLRKVLFDELKLPVGKRTPKGEPSTDAEVLEELAARHDLPRLIVRHRQLDKLKGTYLDALPQLAHADGRIHSSFSQVVASTGRLSSSDPNLQNIPVRTEDGRQIRQAFVAGFPGWSLLTADYSQIELRVLAHFSKDPTLLEAFEADRDIHSVVASQIFNVPEADVTSDQRRVAKTVNFGVIYGLSAYGLAARLGITQPEAGAFIDAYFERYAGVTAFIRRTLEEAKTNSRVQTILGRRRAIQGVRNTERMTSQPERVAVNAVIQGSAADLIKKAMLLIDERMRKRGMKSRMLLQIHDELVFEAPDGEMADLSGLVREAMTTALPLDVPLKVDMGVGPNWLDVVDLPDA